MEETSRRGCSIHAPACTIAREIGMSRVRFRLCSQDCHALTHHLLTLCRPLSHAHVLFLAWTSSSLERRNHEQLRLSPHVQDTHTTIHSHRTRTHHL